MDSSQTLFIISQLILGAATSFLAIMFWSKTRDAAWMLIIIGAIIAYIEIIHSILGLFGLDGSDFIHIGTVSVISFVLPSLRMLIFIAAFLVMLVRQSRTEK
jgi:uncharacterized membrane protein